MTSQDRANQSVCIIDTVWYSIDHPALADNIRMKLCIRIAQELDKTGDYVNGYVIDDTMLLETKKPPHHGNKKG